LHYDEVDQFSEEDPVTKEEHNELEAWNKMIEEAERAAEAEDDDDEFDGVEPTEKAAMQQWKAENPEGSLKIQRRLYKTGKIAELPWTKYLQPEDDYADVDPDVLEAARWAEEQIEKQKTSYVQNSEQTDATIWQRVKQAKDDN